MSTDDRDRGPVQESPATPPLAAQRHHLILQLLEQDGAVRTTDLARRLAVSPMTVRRDLRLLARRRSYERVHGGMVRARSGLGGR